MGRRGILICAGYFYGIPFPLEREDLIIAVDGGFRYCQEEGISPSLILGDLDSLRGSSLENPPSASYNIFSENPKEKAEFGSTYQATEVRQVVGGREVLYYNALRKNRISGYTPATSVTLQDLLDERRVELFCEGHRLYDLVRNKINVKSSYIANPNKEYDYLNPALITELPQREKNLSPELVLEAAK